MNRHLSAWLASLLPAALLGCAHAPAPAPASAEELRALREEVRSLRSDREQDRRRLRALEAVVSERSSAAPEASGASPSSPDAPAARPALGSMPDLAVVRLVPEAAPDEEDSFVFIADGGPGPSRAATSGKLQSRTGGPEAAPALPVRVDLAGPEAATPPQSAGMASLRSSDSAAQGMRADPSGPAGSDPAAYRQGIAALEAGEAARAIELLESFVTLSPKDPRADNAILAVGDAWLALEMPGNALRAFERVVRDFPAGDVVPEALLRYGETCRILGREAAAQAAFQRLVRNHPASIAATRAELHLAAR